jgi:hypothetical protein
MNFSSLSLCFMSLVVGFVLKTTTLNRPHLYTNQNRSCVVLSSTILRSASNLHLKILKTKQKTSWFGPKIRLI